MDISTRAEWRNFEGNKFMVMDFKHCSDEERIEISKHAIRLIQKEGFNSVKMIIDVRSTSISVESMRVSKKDWVNLKPHLNRTAMIGVNGPKSMMLKLWGFMTSIKVKTVKSEEEALQFLFSK